MRFLIILGILILSPSSFAWFYADKTTTPRPTTTTRERNSILLNPTSSAKPNNFETTTYKIKLIPPWLMSATVPPVKTRSTTKYVPKLIPPWWTVTTPPVKRQGTTTKYIPKLMPPWWTATPPPVKRESTTTKSPPKMLPPWLMKTTPPVKRQGTTTKYIPKLMPPWWTATPPVKRESTTTKYVPKMLPPWLMTTKKTPKPAEGEMSEYYFIPTPRPSVSVMLLMQKMKAYTDPSLISPPTQSTARVLTTTTRQTTRPAPTIKDFSYIRRTMLPPYGSNPRLPTPNPVNLTRRNFRRFEPDARYLPPACRLPPNRGLCAASINAWYFDTRDMICKHMKYQTCKGNANRFPTRAACENYCIDLQRDPCSNAVCTRKTECAPREDERCQAMGDQSCPPSWAVCQNKRYPEYAIPVLYRTSQFRRPAECNQPKDTGTCYGRQRPIMKYYYVPQLNDCKSFYFSGCGGNNNRFDTESQCMNQCS